MPGDAFQSVLPGQKLEIPAAAHNAFLKSARTTRGKLREADRDDEPEFRQSGIVGVRNTLGVFHV